MASSEIKSGALVSLEDLHPNSPNFKQGASLRVTGKMEEIDFIKGSIWWFWHRFEVVGVHDNEEVELR
ncbi:hypothetical protein L484_004102 [Morus notabilis]|uniref:Uncharacterized protein n=1 Tax=Morus notabilis TaxID=981085 RepID=W9QWY2_9ROSA|nr:hypothetical protein L484_004102 [Morus notabilis]